MSGVRGVPVQSSEYGRVICQSEKVSYAFNEGRVLFGETMVDKEQADRSRPYCKSFCAPEQKKF